MLQSKVEMIINEFLMKTVLNFQTHRFLPVFCKNFDRDFMRLMLLIFKCFWHKNQWQIF